MKTELIHIDDLTRICGYFNSDTHIYSGYCCDHEDCQDTRLVKKVKGEWVYVDERYPRTSDILALRMTKRNIKCNKRLAKKFIKKARALDYSEYPKYGYKQQGGCFDYSCPLAHSADEQDFIEHGEDPDDYCQTDWLVIETKLKNKLEED